MRRLLALLMKEFLQMRRDRVTYVLMISLPIVQLTVFGFAINTDVKHLPTIVFDQSLQQEGRDFVSSLSASEYFDIDYTAKSYQEVTDNIEQGNAKVGVIIPPDFSENAKHGRSSTIQIIVDATDSMAASSAISAAQLVGQLKSQQVLLKQLQGYSGKSVNAPYDVRIRPWYNPDFISAYYIMPGVSGLILTITLVGITSMAIVREREQGTLEQLLVTPLKSYELLLGKIIPYIVVGYVQVTVALLVGIFVFDLPMRGSIGLLYVLTSFFIVASLSLGILISTLAKTQTQAIMLSFFIFLPSTLLSGFMFPREAMPKFFYYLSDLLPLTYYLQIVRGIVLKGLGVNFFWSQVCALTTCIMALLTISILKFQKKVA